MKRKRELERMNIYCLSEGFKEFLLDDTRDLVGTTREDERIGRRPRHRKKKAGYADEGGLLEYSWSSWSLLEYSWSPSRLEILEYLKSLKMLIVRG